MQYPHYDNQSDKLSLSQEDMAICKRTKIQLDISISTLRGFPWPRTVELRQSANERKEVAVSAILWPVMTHNHWKPWLKVRRKLIALHSCHANQKHWNLVQNAIKLTCSSSCTFGAQLPFCWLRWFTSTQQCCPTIHPETWKNKNTYFRVFLSENRSYKVIFQVCLESNNLEFWILRINL